MLKCGPEKRLELDDNFQLRDSVVGRITQFAQS